MTNRFIIITTLLSLAACGKAPEKKADDGPSASGNIVEEVAPEREGRNSFSPENAATGANAPSPAEHAVPLAFHGRWGMVPGDCGPDAAIAKGLMTVDGKQLRFYESVGKPAVVTSPTPTRLEGRFSFTGEGMDWSKDMTLTLGGNGDTLIRTEKDPTASYTYKRCPAI
ncbi:MAG: hypothetical protein ABW048_11695 [Sphingobium sp.]